MILIRFEHTLIALQLKIHLAVGGNQNSVHNYIAALLVSHLVSSDPEAPTDVSLGCLFKAECRKSHKIQSKCYFFFIFSP